MLLIEDDASVSDVLRHLLARHGHRVLHAPDGTQGAAYFASHEKDIALVIVDCGLPDVDGVALCRVFRKLAPNLPIMVTSGWESAPARALVGQGPTVFLQKPFFPSDVLKQVVSMLPAKS